MGKLNIQIRGIIIVGGGLAGLSAAIYLGRSRRDTLELPRGFPDGINGTDLLAKGMAQVSRFQVDIIEDDIQSLVSGGVYPPFTKTKEVGWAAYRGNTRSRCRVHAFPYSFSSPGKIALKKAF